MRFPYPPGHWGKFLVSHGRLNYPRLAWENLGWNLAVAGALAHAAQDGYQRGYDKAVDRMTWGAAWD